MDEAKYTSRCPRYGVCSVNSCPLDIKIRPTYPDDPEKTCKAHLRERLEIAAAAKADGVKLPLGGLRRDEIARIEDGESMDALISEWDAKVASRRARGQIMRRSRSSTAPEKAMMVFIMVSPLSTIIISAMRGMMG